MATIRAGKRSSGRLSAGCRRFRHLGLDGRAEERAGELAGFVALGGFGDEDCALFDCGSCAAFGIFAASRDADE
jgi:hypothetical protein